MAVTFREVDPKDLHEIWDTILPDLNRAIAHSPEKSICSGEVYIQLKQNKDVLLVLFESDGKYAGFAALQLLEEFSTKVMNIWLMSLAPGIFDEAMDVCKRFASRHKCQVIRASSTREGAGKRLQPFGFSKSVVTYELEIE